MRFPHGATRRPPNPRPGNGYGRPLRPGPSAWCAPDGFETLAFQREQRGDRRVDLDAELARLTVTLDLAREELAAR